MIALDKCGMAVATGGTASIVLGAALAEHQALGAAHDGDWGRFYIQEGSAWETVRGTYTHSGTTLALELIDSSTGSLLTLTTAAEVYLEWTSEDAKLVHSIAGASLFGDGSDGNVTVSTGVALTRDMYYDNLTLAAGGQIVCGNTNAAVRIFVRGTLDLTAADAYAIISDGKPGGTAAASTTNSSSSTGGASGGSAATELTIGSSGSGNSGGGGGNTVGGTPGNSAAAVPYGAGGAGGAGGRGAHGWDPVGTGHVGGSGGAITTPLRMHHLSLDQFVLGNTFIKGGAGGGGGGAGKPGGYASAGGGGGGAGGNMLIICARRIVTGGSTPASVICARGGEGGGGGNAGANTYTGGGGGGGGGGALVIVVGARVGAPVADLLNANGGAGGVRGAPAGYSYFGSGGSGGSIVIVNLSAGTFAVSTQSTAPVTGTTGSAGAGGITKATL